jgi:hypothetical protein
LKFYHGRRRDIPVLMEEDEKKGGEDGEKHNILAGVQSPVHVP